MSPPSAPMSSCDRASSLHSLACSPSSLLGSRSVAITLAPSSLNFSAMARPMPCPAAVTSATFPCSLRLMHALRLLPVQRRETCALEAFTIEILRREPALEVALALRQFAGEHRVPGVVAVAALGDHVLAERPFIDEPVAQGGAP